MGFKRPFVNEEFQELPFKHSRQIDYSNKLTQFGEIFPRHNVPEKASFDVEGESAFCKSRGQGRSEDETWDEESNYADLDFGTSIPFPWVAKVHNGEDASGTTLSSLSHGYFELDLPRRTFNSFEDAAYSSLLDRSPRKQVPIGADHQANIPIWLGDRKAEKSDSPNTSLGNHMVQNENEEKLMGTCIIPMPEYSLSAEDKSGEGRKDCICLDRGSVRCACQHVKEARDSLLKTFGPEKSASLGFHDMGEEVALKWTEEEEQLFHEVIYSNPVSQGQNFWRHLAAEFPCRTKKEIVSYYFNVFILKRRSIQNRSCLLDIDSDDDEWHVGYGGSFGSQFSDDDEDSVVESPVDQDLEMNHGRRVYSHHNEDDEDDRNDSDDGDDCCGADMKGADAMLSDDCVFDSSVKNIDRVSGSNGEELKVEDDSCMSFELQQNISHSPGRTDNGMPTCIEKSESQEFKQKRLVDCNDPESHTYLFEPCDSKSWDAQFTAVPAKSTDLLSTRSIIEEIFGQGTWDNRDMK